MVVACCWGLLAVGVGQAAGKPVPGSIDRSFGDRGVVVRPPGPVPVSSPYGPFGEDMVVGPRNEIFVLQGYQDCGGADCTVEFAIQRYLPDGTLDSQFGQGGSSARFAVTMEYPLPESRSFGALAVGSDGEPVVATTDHGNVALFRFDTRGQLSGGFGSGGIVISDFGGSERRPAIAIDRKGRIVIASGSVQRPDFGSAVILARYLPDGALDPSFGAGLQESRDPGWMVIPGLMPGALGLSGTGGPVVAGAGCCIGADAVYSGRRDENGGLLGGATTSHPWRYLRAGGNPWVTSVIARPHGKVYLAGVSNRGLFAARLQSSGRPDRSFGNAGLVWFPAMSNGASPAIADSSGRLYVAGQRWSNGGSPSRGIVARLTAKGRHDRSWGRNPRGYARLTTDIDNVRAMGFQSNGRLVLFGEIQGECVRGCSLPGQTLTRVFAGPSPRRGHAHGVKSGDHR